CGKVSGSVLARITELGPRRRTVTERLVALTKLPYWMGSVVVVLLVGPPGVFLASYIETRRVGDAYYLTSSRSAFTLTQVGEQLPVVQGLLLVILFTIILAPLEVAPQP